MTNRHWLEITEYISLAASVAGTIVATSTQQVAVGLTPITLTIALNIINRQRIYQLNQQHKEAEILPIAALTQRLNQMEISSQQINLKTQQKLTQHQESIDKMESITQLVENLESLSQQINLQNQQQFEALKQTIILVQTEVKTLTPKQQIVKIEDAISLLHHQLEKVEEQNQQINPQIQEQLAEIKEAIAPIITLNQRIAELEKITQQINERLIESVKNYNTKMDSVNQRLVQLEISEQEINPQIQQQFAEIKYAISHIDNIYDFFAKLKKQETLNQSPPSVPPEYRKESIFQREGEDNQTESNETEKPETSESRSQNIWQNEIEEGKRDIKQNIDTAQNDIQQGKREIEESVKKLGESLNNLFKP